MIAPALIVINGIPGTGKSTLAKKLSTVLDIPHISSDDIKELLFDKLGSGDIAWSAELGTITTDMLFALTEGFLARSRSLIVESAFTTERAVPRFGAFLARYPFSMVEVYCRTDSGVRRERFRTRSERGDRHPGHYDSHYYDASEDEWLARHAPLAVKDVLKVDTTHPLSDTTCAQLAMNIQLAIREQYEQSRQAAM